MRSKGCLAVLSGVLIALSLPGVGAWPLVFVALVPLFIALEGRHPILAGYFFGVALFAADLRWILTLVRFSPLVVPGTVLLVAGLSLHFAAFAFLFRRPETRLRPAGVVLSAVSWFTLAEFARSLGPLGMGFSALHLSLYRVPVLIQSAAVFGPWTVTALIVAVNAFFYVATARRQLRYAVAGIATIGIMAAFALYPIPPDAGPPIRAAVVGSNVRQEVKLDGGNLPEVTERYVSLGQDALTYDPDLIVFPESILPAYILRDAALLARFRELAVAGDAQVLFGTGDVRQREIFNSVALLSPDGDLVGIYDMLRPVPFGEVVPGRRVWEAIGLGPLVDSFLPLDLSRGEDAAPLDGLGTPICFESTFASSARAFVARGAELLVTVTNDAWFAGASELEAHFAASAFRAVETRRWLIQSANGGISGIVDPRGRVIASSRDEGVVTGDVFRRGGLSPYARWGDGPLLGLLGAMALGGFLLGRRNRRERE